MLALEMLRYALERGEAELGELRAQFQALDAKCQATAGIAGTMLGLVLVFIPQATAQSPLFTKVLIYTNVALLALISVIAICVMRVRWLPTPPPSRLKIEEILDSLGAGKDVEERFLNAIRSELDPLQQLIKSLRPAVESRGRWVRRVQLLLLVASLSTALLIVIASAQ